MHHRGRNAQFCSTSSSRGSSVASIPPLWHLHTGPACIAGLYHNLQHVTCYVRAHACCAAACDSTHHPTDAGCHAAAACWPGPAGLGSSNRQAAGRAKDSSRVGVDCSFRSCGRRSVPGARAASLWRGSSLCGLAGVPCICSSCVTVTNCGALACTRCRPLNEKQHGL